MPNVTYIKINHLQNTWSSFTNTSDIVPIATIRYKNNSDYINNNDNINIPHNLTSDVLLLLEEQHKNGSRLFNGSSFAIAVVVCAFLTLLVGCCCACNWYNQYPNSAANNIKKRQRQRHQLLIENGNVNTTTRNHNRNNRNSAIAAVLVGTINRNDENNQRLNENHNTEDNMTIRSDNNQNFNTTFREYFRDRNNERNRRLRNSFNSNNRSNNDVNEGRQDHHGDQSPEIVRRYDIDVESLPSYTLVSGLPTYDDALEQFRKPGIIITTPNIMKIFENYKPSAESNQTTNTENIQSSKINSELESPESATNLPNQNSTNENSSTLPSSSTSSSSPSLSLSHTNIPTIMITPNIIESSSSSNCNNLIGGGNNVTQIIELGPDQLNLLSKKRLSVQIAFNSHPISRSQNNLTHLKNSINGKLNILTNNNNNDLPLLHGRTPSLSVRHLTDRRLSDSVRNSLYIKNSKRNVQHRGSLG
ncbi:putative uncharacterized protein DDB_G0289263 [Condylostylus longicornis]|uniref:putative uncharacterized protein DDB_G0289263 n=1 Tax=Condylostylus longicornis TaxID=2530218 RepID=UPI00244DB11A|nr:putative uncharacterized protein DDB_G0289263 [Condylostylus longicornis]